MNTENLDIVIPLKINGNNNDLRFCLRAIAQNVPHRQIWIVGQKPDWITGVGFIEVPFDPNVQKYQRINNNLWAAINHPGVTDDFIRWDDDMFALHPISHLDYMHNGLLKRSNRADIYGQSVNATMAELEEIGIKPINYELHVPMIFNQDKFKHVWLANKVLQYRSFYGNFWGVGGWPVSDNKIYRLDARTDLSGNDFVSTSNQSFASGMIGKQIRELFPRPCKFEAEYSMNKPISKSMRRQLEDAFIDGDFEKIVELFTERD